MRLQRLLILLWSVLAVAGGSARAAAVDPTDPHGGIAIACNACHTTEDWLKIRPTAEFDHQKTSFPLTGRHGQVTCRACHGSLLFREAATTCAGCHADVHRGQFAQTACADCHTPQAWSHDALMRDRHQKSRFPLVGVHAALECNACHGTGQYAGLSTVCTDCHYTTYTKTDNPAHAAIGFSTRCEECHSISRTGWQDASASNSSIQHPASFPLSGGHAAPRCTECHKGNYRNLPAQCFGCHEANFAGTTNPNHVSSQFSHECGTCHSIAGWSPATFDHSATQFPLTGGHVNATCVQCHVGGQYSGTSRECYSCHQSDFEQVQDPNHVSGQYDHRCDVCHTVQTWDGASFDHTASDFPLTGVHATTECAQCHVNAHFNNTPTDCYACHETNYAGTTNPNHTTGNYPHTCGQCHGTSGWTGAAFDHNTFTQFPLTGAHQTVTCLQCHAGGQFQNTPSDCYSCHQGGYQSAPNHASAQFPHECTMCHTTAAWEPSTFNHAGTNFPLTGRHATTACAECHRNGQYAGTATACFACHESDYNNADDPNHVANQFSHSCQECHNTNGWDDAAFNHNSTNFPLTGRHATIYCIQCHVDGHYSGTPTDCYACHRTAFEQTQSPNHVQAQFPQTCALCHSTAGWTPSTFNHATTAFPLTGRHTTTACAQCHANGVYAGTPTDCYACHTADFKQAQDPNHVQALFPHTCTTCHNTAGWSPSTFNHSSTNFPLTGAHIGADCRQCHRNGQYAGTPTDCYFCHVNDYNGTTDPNHAAAHFPTACAECHSTTTWTGATFNHDGQYFRIYSGEHRNEWNTCADCHVNASDFSIFSCITCHEHNRQDTDDEHDEVGNYVYNATSCYTCHRNVLLRQPRDTNQREVR